MSELAPEQLKVTNLCEFVTSLVSAIPAPITNKIVLAYVNGDECPCVAFVDMDKDWVETLEKVIDLTGGLTYDQAIFTVFTERGDGELPFANQVKDIISYFDTTSLHLLDVLLVDGNRYWSYMCAGDGCCDINGNFIEQAVLAIAPPPVEESPEIEVLNEADIQAICEQFEGRVPALAKVTWNSLQALTEPYMGTVEARNQYQAEVIAGVQNIKVRDWTMCQIIQGEGQEQALIDALLECVKVAPVGLQARIAAVGAMLLKASDADHNAIWAMLDLSGEESLGRLVRTAVTHNVPSRVARDSITAVIQTCTEEVQELVEAN
jgi:hypothetical protein